MRRHVNAAAVAVTAAALLAGSALTAGPASGNPVTSLTRTYCQQTLGGIYNVVKGLRTCTVGPYFTRYVDVNNVYGEGVYGAGTYTLPAYFGYWTEHRGWDDSTVTTQKGGNVATQTTVTNSTLVSRWISDELCGYDTGSNSYYATVLDCYIAGVYPPNIP